MISVRLEDASIADICWGLGFVLLVWLYCLLSPTLTSRSWLVASLITLWAVRLSLHIFRRNHGKGRTRATRRCAPRMGGPSGGGVSSPSSGCRARSCGSSPFRSLSRCAPAHRPPSPPSTAWEFCSSRSGSASRSWATINSSASGPSLPIAARCSTVGCGATRGIPITSETRRCGGASMPSRPQRPADGSPC